MQLCYLRITERDNTSTTEHHREHFEVEAAEVLSVKPNKARMKAWDRLHQRNSLNTKRRGQTEVTAQVRAGEEKEGRETEKMILVYAMTGAFILLAVRATF